MGSVYGFPLFTGAAETASATSGERVLKFVASTYDSWRIAGMNRYRRIEGRVDHGQDLSLGVVEARVTPTLATV